MAEQKKSDVESRNVFDVSAPGKTPANATSRPVILKGRSLMRDPMMADKTQAEADEVDTNSGGAQTEIPSKSKKTIEPSSSSDQEENSENSQAEPEGGEPKGKVSNESASSDMSSPVVDALADVAVKAKKPKTEPPKIREALQQHIDQKTYYVPIAQLTKKRIRLELFMSLVVLMAVLGLYLAIDAGLILKDITLPVNLIG